MTPTVDQFRDTIADLENEVSKLEAMVSLLEDDKASLESELEDERYNAADRTEIDTAAAEIETLEETNWQLEHGMGEAIEALERGDAKRALELLELATRAPKWRDLKSCQTQFDGWLLERATAANGGEDAPAKAGPSRKRRVAA